MSLKGICIRTMKDCFKHGYLKCLIKNRYINTYCSRNIRCFPLLKRGNTVGNPNTPRCCRQRLVYMCSLDTILHTFSQFHSCMCLRISQDGKLFRISQIHNVAQVLFTVLIGLQIMVEGSGTS